MTARRQTRDAQKTRTLSVASGTLTGLDVEEGRDMNPITVTDIGLIPATQKANKTGLLGWVTCTINDTLILDGIALRRTADGRLTLNYPTRRDRTGKQHSVFRPINDEARVHLEREIFKSLQLDLEETSP